MCGIIGYTGGRSCLDLILSGLERLEYRGYDSAGLALVRRRRGRARCTPSATSSTCARRSRPATATSRATSASATRAGPPTAGSPTRTPIPTTTSRGRVQIVLNGIVENYADLKARARGRRGRVQLRHRRGGGGPPDREAPRRRRPRRGRAPARTTSCAATTPSSRCPPTSRTCWSAPARSARWWSASATASTSSPPRSPPSSPRPAAIQLVENDEIVAVRPDGRRVPERRRQRGRARGRGGRLGRGGRREGRLRDLHAQGDPRAAGRRGRHRARPALPRHRRAGRHRPDRRRAARTCAGSWSWPAAPPTTPGSWAATRSSGGRGCRSRWTSPRSSAIATR